MEQKNSKRTSRWHWKELLKYCFQGVIVLAPIVITGWAVYSLFSIIDNILPAIIHTIAPGLLEIDLEGKPVNIPGIGFLLVVIILFLVGYFSSFFVVEKVMDVLGSVLERTPGINIIYSSVKDFFEAFGGDKKKFNRPVLVSLANNDIWEVAFITQDSGEHFGLETHVAVYVPFSYSIAGKVYWVPQDRIKSLPQVNGGDAMKFVISGGVTNQQEPEGK